MKNNIKYILLAPVFGLTLAACQDSWDDHYDQYPDTTFGNSSLYEAIKKDNNLSDFCKVLDATKMFANSKMTPTTYKDLLNSDQVFTVWAPKNGTFDVDSLLAMCQTQNGDSLVEQQFIMNHIARYSQADNGKKTTITTLNGKYLHMDNHMVGKNVAMVNGQSNLSAVNGILHTIEKPIDFEYNIYEKLINLQQYSHIGKFFKSYHIDRFSESASLATGANDEGKTEYIDSVFYTYNMLLSWYGPIQREDSSYLMIMPSAELWDSLYKEAKPYFNYSSYSSDSIKNDSVSEFYVHDGILTDFLYNANKWMQHNPDFYVRSTNYYQAQYGEVQYHEYFYPYEPGGIFNLPGTEIDTCSNGIIYNVKTWPFNQFITYNQPIKVEAEEEKSRYWYLYDKGGNPKKTKELSAKSIKTASDSISRGYLDITAAVASDKYWVEYEIPSVLSGTYDIYCVLLPKSVDKNMDMTFPGNLLPNKFTAEISYVGRDRERYLVDSKTRGVLDETKPANYDFSDKNAPYIMECNLDPTKTTRTFVNKPLQVDTVKLCTFKFPTCDYGQSTYNTRIRINNAMESKDARTANSNMFLDCILLIPHVDEESN